MASKKVVVPDLSLPIPVSRALIKLGQDICDARRRRRIKTTLMAERAAISRVTLGRIEKGEAGVSIGAYASVLFVLGMIEKLAQICDMRNDLLGLQLEEERLPLRIRNSRKR